VAARERSKLTSLDYSAGDGLVIDKKSLGEPIRQNAPIQSAHWNILVGASAIQ
jgi:hypothetical protein